MVDPTRPFARLRGTAGAPLTLYQGDSVRDIGARLGPRSVDVVVTSPPYNIGVDYASYDDARPRREYLGWVGRFGSAVDRVLAKDGALFLNVGGPPSDPEWPWEVARAAGRGFVLQNVIHWVKSIAIDREHAGRSSRLDRDLAVGHYKPVNSRRYLNSAQEYIFHFTRRGDLPLDRLAIGVPYQDRSNEQRWKKGGSGLRCRGNAWFLPYPTIRRRATDRPHPASFPPELPEWCLRLHGVPRVRLAVDPFLGIGPSALAALRLGIPFVGYDIEPAYLAEARRTLLAAGAVEDAAAPEGIEGPRNPASDSPGRAETGPPAGPSGR